MATCNINELLAENPCMAALPTEVLLPVTAELWCEYNGGGGGGGNDILGENGDPILTESGDPILEE